MTVTRLYSTLSILRHFVKLHETVTYDVINSKNSLFSCHALHTSFICFKSFRIRTMKTLYLAKAYQYIFTSQSIIILDIIN